MATTLAPADNGIDSVGPALAGPSTVVPGLVLVALSVAAATVLQRQVNGLPLIVAAVLVGALVGNVGLASEDTEPGLWFASRTLLRFGIVLLGLRLSVGDVADLGVGALAVIVATVAVTFFGVQFLGRRLGLTPGLALLVASGFSICGNSAIASVQGVARADDEDVAAAIGLVTLCGTLAMFVVPAIGSQFGLTDVQFGVWVGASVQDTAQVVAVASAAGPAVLAIATAVKLTRVLLLAPIVAGLSVWKQRANRDGDPACGAKPPLVPFFVIGFLAMMGLRTAAFVPADALDAAGVAQQFALAAGAVGLGSAVRLRSLRRLGLKPLLLGAVAWLVVGGVSLLAVTTFGLR